MLKPITTRSIVAYSQCPRKAFLLQCTNEKGVMHEYEQIIQKRRIDNQKKYINMLKTQRKDITQYSMEQFGKGNEFLINAIIKFDGVEAECGVLERLHSDSDDSPNYFPTICIGIHSITKEHKLALMFAGYVLSKIQHQSPETGKIIRIGQRISTLKLMDSFQIIKPFLDRLQAWNGISSLEPPPIILNRHCSHCQFQTQCKTQAEKTDNLSLLDGISTSKLMKKYERKGIFTVNQLSYLYRPRRQRKRSRKPPSLRHNIELQALVLRTGKIYLKEQPQLSRGNIELFLDIEGIPDQQFFYLFGLLVCENDNAVYYAFWADTMEDESQIWLQLMAMLDKYPESPIYHYGSYEAKAIAKLGKRYNTETENISTHLVNINSYIYGKIYFPLRSNNLKEIGKFVGASWTSPDASGLQSVVWRYYWEETQNSEYKQRLLTYNQEDCQALKRVTDVLSGIQERDDSLLDIDCFVHSKKSRSTKTRNPLHTQLESILNFAHANYNKNKICFREEKESKANLQRIPKKLPPRKKKYRKVTRKIQVPEALKCSKCGSKSLRIANIKTERTQVDLVFTRYGVRKSVTKYWAHEVYCHECRTYSKSPELKKKCGRSKLYGYGFKIWIAYQRIALRLSYRNIGMIIEDMFDERFAVAMITDYLQQVAWNYSQTEEWIIQQLLSSPFLHVDETLIDIDHVNQYVWVVTNGKYVIFKHTETREASFVHELLGEYKGILIADFYPGYDALTCKQQKCLVHLIRDVNNDLYANPFDIEFEKFVIEVKNVIVPIMEAIQRYGLKKRHLNKFKKNVNKFYANTITDKMYKSDLCSKYQERFIRYRESLFTFLEHDNVPWHNNTAENALRHITLQEKISGRFYKSVINEYLTLLGIRQSCKFQNKSFLKFLISGEKRIDDFSKSRVRNVSYTPEMDL